MCNEAVGFLEVASIDRSARTRGDRKGVEVSRVKTVGCDSAKGCTGIGALQDCVWANATCSGTKIYGSGSGSPVDHDVPTVRSELEEAKAGTAKAVRNEASITSEQSLELRARIYSRWIVGRIGCHVENWTKPCASLDESVVVGIVEFRKRCGGIRLTQLTARPEDLSIVEQDPGFRR